MRFGNPYAQAHFGGAVHGDTLRLSAPRPRKECSVLFPVYGSASRSFIHGRIFKFAFR